MTGSLSFTEARAAIVAALDRAAHTLRRLPMPAHAMPARPRSTWPGTLPETEHEIPAQPAEALRVRPSPRAISELDRVLPWLSGLDAVDRRLVWARASGLPWPKLARQSGLSVGQVRYRWNSAIDRIVTVAVHDAIVSGDRTDTSRSSCKFDSLGR